MQATTQNAVNLAPPIRSVKSFFTCVCEPKPNGAVPVSSGVVWDSNGKGLGA